MKSSWPMHRLFRITGEPAAGTATLIHDVT
jgi:hypothetical protein